MKIRIELLSDTCLSSGEVYNSSIDTDVVYDQYGLPFITGKRLKGCLRECALELRDWGLDIPVELMFGAKRNQPSSICISNGKLENYAAYVREIEEEPDRTLVHPQRVLSEFTYVRTQTRIDSETGTAARNTLRVTRVMKKGLVFWADVSITGKQKEKFAQALEQCCQALHSMGMNRTRGMGEVSVQLFGDSVCSKEIQTDGQWRSDAEFDLSADYGRLDYEIYLNTAVLCKGIAGGQTHTLDYLDGAKVLGLIAQCAGEEFLPLMAKGRLICTNAYISRKGHRCLPIPASVYGVKNCDKEGRNRAALAELKQESVQLETVKDQYAYQQGNTFWLAEVKRQIRYHHSRPEDKGIGHVTEKDESSQMYQLESILEGQTFCGSVYGTREQLKAVYDYLTAQHEFRMGYGRLTEYGEVSIRVTGLERYEYGSIFGEGKKEAVEVSDFYIVFCSPTLLYNEYGMYSTQEASVKKELVRVLGVEENLLEIRQRYLKYTEIGGYNVTWDAKKPTLLAFDKGTAFVCRAKIPVQQGKSRVLFLGERNSEGYGETVFTEVPQDYDVILEEDWSAVAEECAPDTGYTAQGKTDSESIPGLAKPLCGTGLLAGLKKKAARQLVEASAMEAAKQRRAWVEKQENASAVVNQLLQIFWEQPDKTSFYGTVKKRFDRDTRKKQAKKGISDQILCADLTGLMNQVKAAYPEAEVTEIHIYQWYYSCLLLQLKYYVRKGKKE